VTFSSKENFNTSTAAQQSSSGAPLLIELAKINFGGYEPTPVYINPADIAAIETVEDNGVGSRITMRSRGVRPFYTEQIPAVILQLVEGASTRRRRKRIKTATQKNN
jgi:hypothetical protein